MPNPLTTPRRTLRAPSIAGVALVALAPVLALAMAACSPPAATPIPGPTCVPSTASPPAAAAASPAGSAANPAGSGAVGASAPAPTVGPEQTIFTPNPNATPLDLASGSGIIVYADGPLGNGPAHLHAIWPDGTHQGDITAQVIAEFSVSPDHRTVEFGGVRGPYLVGIDGRNERPLAVGGLTTDTFRWSPDSRWLAFHGWSPTDPSVEGIYEVDPTGCQPVKINVAGAEHDIPIAVGPDGSILAFGDADESTHNLELGVIYIDRPSDGKRIRVTRAGSISLVEPSTGDPAAWSPDGKHIAFTSAVATAATWTAASNGVYIADADGSDPKQIITTGIVGGVAWSPASQWIATSKLGPGGVPEVYVEKFDGSKASYLTSFQAPGGCCPIWSPDGKSLLIWGGTIIPFEGSGASKVEPVGAAVTYAYDWVKPKP